MKISRIEFENFRNFRDHGRIDFRTDGRVTVIYGPNGVGKTTLHQLFQWIFYGEVHFNKTASVELYNLDYEASAPLRHRFSVWGAIDFEHPNSRGEMEYYSLRREWIYQKSPSETTIVEKKVRLQKKIFDDWKTISDNPANILEQILPSGLSEYFFFDGESMIADLGQKGKDSAKALRKALYKIFDLDIYEHALIHIGSQDLSSTVLGALHNQLSSHSSDPEIIQFRGLYRQCQKKVEKLEAIIKTHNETIESLNKEVKVLSEQIGGTPSVASLEKQRKDAKKTIKILEDNVKKEMLAFGSTVMNQYPYLLLSRVVEEAQFRIGLKVEEKKLLPGLNKELVESLLEEEVCLCGHPIDENERAALKGLLQLFPPLSYKYIYDQFKSSAVRWSATYKSDLLLKHFEAIFKYRDQIEEFRLRIHEIDETQKQSENLDYLIVRRAKVESDIRTLNSALEKDSNAYANAERDRNNVKKKLDELLGKRAKNKLIQDQIDVMETVKAYFDVALQNTAYQYSNALSSNIQELLRNMLSTTRHVSMTPKFELSVKDNHGNEAKSEGQFAVVSFAYIGGIFKLLKEIPELRGKEFPLILDGPFSKLDAYHRQSVIDTIPSYAPQVILFSKDDINNCFEDESFDVWTIYSNSEKNVSRVENLYDPEVFRAHGSNN